MKAESWTWAAVKSSGFNMIMMTDQISSKIKVHLLWQIMEHRAGDERRKLLEHICKFPFIEETQRSQVGFRCVHSDPDDSSTARQESKAFYNCLNRQLKHDLLNILLKL